MWVGDVAGLKLRCWCYISSLILCAPQNGASDDWKDCVEAWLGGLMMRGSMQLRLANFFHS
jgi:hypothetical protein